MTRLGGHQLLAMVVKHHVKPTAIKLVGNWTLVFVVHFLGQNTVDVVDKNNSHSNCYHFLFVSIEDTDAVVHLLSMMILPY